MFIVNPNFCCMMLWKKENSGSFVSQKSYAFMGQSLMYHAVVSCCKGSISWMGWFFYIFWELIFVTGPVWFWGWELIFTILGNNIAFNLRWNTGNTPHGNTYQLSLFKLLQLRHPFFVIKVLLTIAFFCGSWETSQKQEKFELSRIKYHTVVMRHKSA